MCAWPRRSSVCHRRRGPGARWASHRRPGPMLEFALLFVISPEGCAGILSGKKPTTRRNDWRPMPQAHVEGFVPARLSSITSSPNRWGGSSRSGRMAIASRRISTLSSPFSRQAGRSAARRTLPEIRKMGVFDEAYSRVPPKRRRRESSIRSSDFLSSSRLRSGSPQLNWHTIRVIDTHGIVHAQIRAARGLRCRC